jgi:hypothetical protein
MYLQFASLWNLVLLSTLFLEVIRRTLAAISRLALMSKPIAIPQYTVCHWGFLYYRMLSKMCFQTTLAVVRRPFSLTFNTMNIQSSGHLNLISKMAMCAKRPKLLLMYLKDLVAAPVTSWRHMQLLKCMWTNWTQCPFGVASHSAMIPHFISSWVICGNCIVDPGFLPPPCIMCMF